MLRRLTRALREALDPFLLALVTAVLLAVLVPLPASAQPGLQAIVHIGVGVVFFLHGSRLDGRHLLDSLRSWRLHLAVLGTSFAVFPVIGLAAAAVLGPLVSSELATSVLFLSMLPSTFQSSVAFTSVARGNVPSALVAASLSNTLGIVITPLLAAALLGSRVAIDPSSALGVVAELALPFAAGQLLRPLIRPILDRHAVILGVADRASVVLVAYGAFSASTGAGVWAGLGPSEIVAIPAADLVLLLFAIAATLVLGRVLRLPRGDRVALVFCGSNKGLAAGIAIAAAVFPPAVAGAVVLPVMVYHLVQLLVGAPLARRWSRLKPEPGGPRSDPSFPRLSSSIGTSDLGLDPVGARTCTALPDPPRHRRANTMRRLRTTATALASIALLGITLTGCAADTPSDDGTTSPDAITFQLDFPFAGRHIPYFAAQMEGFYEEAGLDVTLVPGTGGQAVLDQLQNGSAQFAFNPLDQVPVVDASDAAPITALAVIYTKAPQAIFYYPDSGISSPADLEGKTVAVPAGGSPQKLFPVFAAANGVDPDSVQLAPTNAQALIAAFTQGQADAMSTFVISKAAIEKASNGREVDYFLYGDYGVTDLSNGLLARSDFVDANPDLARRFVQATMKGLEWSFEHLDDALEMGEDSIPQLDADIARSELEVVRDLAQSDAAAEHCLGWIDPDRFAETVDTINAVFGTTPSVPVDEMFTNEFLECGQ